jgi:hypothetical protein
MPKPVVLVLDGFDEIHDADVLSGVAMLLRYQLPKLIATVSDHSLASWFHWGNKDQA